MTAADYTPFVERMIQRYEGGYGWDRNDPGGPTKYGITCYDLAEYLHEDMTSMAVWAPRVKAMTLGTADDIYAKKYAAACQFVNLKAGCDCVVFDFGVNSGTSRAIKFAQEIVGTDPDGVMGPMTLHAINAMDSGHFINDLCDVRLRFLQRLRTWAHFGHGWAARVSDLRHYAINLAVPHAVPEMPHFEDKPQLIPYAFGKGY